MDRVLKSSLVVIIALALVSGLGAPSSAQDSPRTGGVLKVAIIGEPPSLDLHMTTAGLAQEITWNIYETLYTYDRSFNPIPLLAESHALTDGGKRLTITLRRGVKFHNGKEMTAADAAASLARWGRVAGLGKTMWKNVTSVEPSGPNTLVIALKAPSGVLLSALARPNNGAVIYPKDVIDAAGDGPIKQFIGTGPFRFVEHKPDRHIKLARFADYAARKEASDGYGGARNAYVDEINFMPVPDVAVRLAGVETGEYHYAQRIQQDQYARIQAMPAVAPRIAKPYGWVLAGFNHKQGLMTDKKIRQAFQAALDMEPILAAAFGSPSFYRLDPALMFPEQSLWHSTAGAALYNQKDKAKAKRLLAEAGYKGQPVRWLTTREYEYMYKNAIVAKQQLEEAGFAIDLQIVDWATLMQRRGKPELYDVFSTGLAFSADPTLHSSIDCNYPATGAGWCQEAKTRLLDSLMSEVDPKKRRALWEQLQKAFYDEAVHVKYGDYFTMDAVRKEVRGVPTSPEMHYWNVWLAR